MYEENMQQLVRESRKKVHEVNQAKLESDHRLRNAEFEVVRRTDMNRNSENEAIARLRMESLRRSNHERQLEHYEELYSSTAGTSEVSRSGSRTSVLRPAEPKNPPVLRPAEPKAAPKAAVVAKSKPRRRPNLVYLQHPHRLRADQKPALSDL